MLFIQVFYDDFECVNPLGSKTKKRKIGGIYFSIRNLPPQMISKLDNIFLAALFYVNDVKTGICRYDDILRPLIKDVKNLETEGIVINNTTFFASISCISYDNLGANSLLGFTESFNSNNFCRFCLTETNKMQSVFHEKHLLMRNNKSHIKVCSEIQPGEMQMGVKNSTIISTLETFGFCEMLTVDVMHDLLEGVVPYEIKEFLKTLYNIDRKIIEKINNRIEAFNYGLLEATNKPSPINLNKHGHSLGQKTAQMWCFARHFPLLVQDLLTDDMTPKFEVILLLLDIMDIAFAPKISTGMVLQLEELISEHNLKFKTVFDCKHIPKHHMMLHYSGVIRRLGPLVHLWCMRYESKHNYFVRLSEKVCNFKNICKTLATRHQEHISFHPPIIDHNIEYGTRKKDVILDHKMQTLASSFFGWSNKTENENLIFYNWCKIGIYY